MTAAVYSVTSVCLTDENSTGSAKFVRVERSSRYVCTTYYAPLYSRLAVGRA